jgi:hypothetical protein
MSFWGPTFLLGTSFDFLKTTSQKPLKPFEELLLGLGQQ